MLSTIKAMLTGLMASDTAAPAPAPAPAPAEQPEHDYPVMDCAMLTWMETHVTEVERTHISKGVKLITLHCEDCDAWHTPICFQTQGMSIRECLGAAMAAHIEEIAKVEKGSWPYVKR